MKKNIILNISYLSLSLFLKGSDNQSIIDAAINQINDDNVAVYIQYADQTPIEYYKSYDSDLGTYNYFANDFNSINESSFFSISKKMYNNAYRIAEQFLRRQQVQEQENNPLTQ